MLYKDHISHWTDGLSWFVLCEPYISTEPETTQLAFIEVPPNLAPYCGGYDAKLGALPWTRAWLFGWPDDKWKLRSIEHKLIGALALVPEWNKV
jgi:hypothetical protein